MATPQSVPELPQPRKETFDVVMLAAGKTEFDAHPDDFRRVTVRAESTLAAGGDPAVAAAATTHRTFAIMPQGVLSPAEILARGRAQNGPVVDKSKV
jgi:hypothetical protein